MRVLIYAATSVLAIIVSSCGRQDGYNPGPRLSDKASGQSAVLAVVGGDRITLGDFEAEMARRVRDSGTHFATERQRRELLDEMIQFKVLLQRAKAAGYEHDPRLVAKLDRLIVGQFKEDHLATNDESAVTVSDDEVREFYALNQPRFAMPEAVRVAVIYFRSSPKATGEKRAEVNEKAASVLAEARQRDATGFSDLVRKYSDDQSTRYSGGDIGWLARGDAAQAKGSVFERAAFGIHEAGEFAPLVETPDGFYIVRLLEKRPAGVRPFEQVKDAIAYQVARERRQRRQNEFLEEMRKDVKIETNPSLLENISAPEAVSDHAPPLPKG